MDEIRDLLESQELKAVVEALEALRAANDPKKGLSKGQFARIALGPDLLIAPILKILVSEEYDPGLREVLAAGFASWVRNPNYSQTWYEAMCRAAVAHMDFSESRAVSIKQSWTLGRDVVSRYLFTGSYFLDEVYFALGGYQAFRNVDSDETLQFVNNTERALLDTIVIVVAHMHHAADNYCNQRIHHSPSLNRSVHILADLKRAAAKFSFMFVSRTLLHERWSASKATIALLYAADSIRVGDGSLLDLISKEDLRLRTHSRFIQSWLKRASYVARHVFATASDQTLLTHTISVVGGFEPEPFPPKALSSIETELVKKHYRKN